MDVLKFSLSGKTAFFKKPEVNTYYSFTYGNIHKVALLGIYGAILGYNGYANMDTKKEMYPEFYEKLKDLQCAILPCNENGFIHKKMQQFNNSVGYASQEQGGNLIVKEQWLENPFWNIYLAIDCEEAEKIAVEIMKNHCVYMPYLGKNDHMADIKNPVIYKDCFKIKSYHQIHSLFLKKYASYADPEDFEEELSNIKDFKYEEALPTALDSKTHMYQHETFIQTNLPILYEKDVYLVENKNITFF